MRKEKVTKDAAGSPRATASKLPYRGIIEGFYGPLWSHEERLHLLHNLRQWNMNLYIYAPKNDPYHRFRWDVPYPPAEVQKFEELARAARRENVLFSIALSPGNSLNPRRRRHRQQLLDKLYQFVDIGCEFFSILYDDLHGFTDFASPAAAAQAESQADLMNGLVAEITRRLPEARFSFCPTEYGTAEKSPYLSRLHELLAPPVEVICTGMDGPGYQIAAHTVSNEVAEKYSSNFGRKPFLWDNFNTSDWALNELHWSPYSGRADRLDELCSGIVINPQNIYCLNLPVFATMGAYFANPVRYQPERAMAQALEQLMGKQGARLGRVLAQWYISEISGNISSVQNLPKLGRAFSTSKAQRRESLKQIKETVAPLLSFQDAAEHTLMPPTWSGHLQAYCDMLKWWSYTMHALCDSALEKTPISEVSANATQQAIGELRGYSYRLPASLLAYLEDLLERVS